MSIARYVFLARHGETDWNATGRWQGQTDVPLNANGRVQARALAERLRGEGVGAIAASDLLRARGTAEIVAEVLGLRVDLVDSDLREQRFGRFEGFTRSECEERFPEDWARYVADPRSAPPGGESRSALVARAVAAVGRIAERFAPLALVVTHGGVIRALLHELPDGVPGAALAGRAARIPNGGLLRVRFAEGRVVDAAWLDAAE
jgi:broad specificity phosphatase PhoE